MFSGATRMFAIFDSWQFGVAFPCLSCRQVSATSFRMRQGDCSGDGARSVVPVIRRNSRPLRITLWKRKRSIDGHSSALLPKAKASIGQLCPILEQEGAASNPLASTRAGISKVAQDGPAFGSHVFGHTRRRPSLQTAGNPGSRVRSTCTSGRCSAQRP